MYYYLLRSVFLEIPEDSCKLQAMYNYRHSCTADNKVQFGNTAPCTLQDIGKFFHDYTILDLRIFCRILDQDQQLKKRNNLENTFSNHKNEYIKIKPIRTPLGTFFPKFKP